MLSPIKKLRIASLISCYPLVSTFAMTLIWQIMQLYCDPFLGGYYFKWVFIYTLKNPNWLEEESLTLSRVYYSVYVLGGILLAIATVLLLVRRRGKAICAWIISALWLADSAWIVRQLCTDGVSWQGSVNLAEHLLFLAAMLWFSFWYLKLRKSSPELFPRKKKKRPVYRARFH